MLNLADEIADKWPAVRASIEYNGSSTYDESAGDRRFIRELYCFFCRLQEAFNRLGEAEKAECGQDKVAFEISLQIDRKDKKIVLDKLFKYADIHIHLFTELLELLKRHFPDYDLEVPSLQGYELAREIRRFLGVPEVECVFLKGDTEERLLMGEALAGLSFDDILKDTQKHYEERGGSEAKRQNAWRGRELPMYRLGPEGEEAVLWMQVRIALSR